MKTLLERVKTLDVLIRELRKTESSVYSGRIIDAYRQIGSLVAWAEKNRHDVIANEERVVNEVTGETKNEE